MNLPVDENLSQEFLTENVYVSSMRTTPNLAKNMSNNPFTSKSVTGESERNQIVTGCWEPAVEKSINIQEYRKQRKMVKKGLPSKKFASLGIPKLSKLQWDIRELLHRAMKIKNPLLDCDREEGICKETKPEIPKKLIVTMRDVKSAE